MADYSIVSVAFTLVGSIAGSGAVAALVAHYTAVARADREYKLRKLEEVYMLAADLYDLRQHEINEIFHPDEIEEEAKERAREIRLKEKEIRSRLRMIAGIYFVSLIPTIDELLDECDDFACQICWGNTKALYDIDDKIDKAVKCLKGRILAESNSIRQTVIERIVNPWRDY